MKEAPIMPSLDVKGRIPDRWQAVRNFFSGRNDAVQGLAAIEFAIIAPSLVLMAICTADLGLGIYTRMQVQNAAQYGATFAAIHGFDPPSGNSITSAVTSFIGNNIKVRSFSRISMTSSTASAQNPNQFCGCASTSGITAQACTTPCADLSPLGTYVSVSTQGNYTTILPYPLIPNSYSFASQATVRIQ